MNNEMSTTSISRPAGSIVLSASSLASDDVYDYKGEKLGSIKDIMLDMPSGRVSYVVLSFGGFLSIGEKLFAVPWSALKLDKENHRVLMDTSEAQLQQAPGFDPDHWPNMGDQAWEKTIHSYYGTPTRSDY